MKNTLILVFIWIAIISLSFLWNHNTLNKEQKEIALLTSRGIFEHIVTTRLWNARLGSLYAPVTPQMQPNRYLELPMRELKINESLTLTQINPSFMTRQISEIAKEQNGIQFHMTSLHPIRPQNKPNFREKTILTEFKNGTLEKDYFIDDINKKYYFYMAPLKAEKECLKCHINKGYVEGDIMGGISLKLPMVTQLPNISLILGHLSIGILGLLGIIIGIRRLNAAYGRIRHQAIIDSLTGIPNRRYFTETILKEFSRSRRELQPLSIILCDIDNFKLYNDTYGHSKGDSCLHNVAQTIDRSIERTTDFCARYGGEEFVVILPNTTSNGAIKIAERIRANIEKSAIVHENSLPMGIVTLSLGVATLEVATDISYEKLIQQSDIALYRAKEQGKNRVCNFDYTIHQ